MDGLGVVREALGLLGLANRVTQDRCRLMRVGLRDGSRLPERIQVGVFPYEAADQRILIVRVEFSLKKIGHEARASLENARVVSGVLLRLRKADGLGGARRAGNRIGEPLACVAQLGICVNS